MNISKGNTILINGVDYEMLSMLDEADKLDVEKKALVGEHLEIALHKVGDKSLLATNYLFIYKDDPSKISLSGKNMTDKKKVMTKNIKIKR
jgi:hypothetical protein